MSNLLSSYVAFIMRELLVGEFSANNELIL